MMRNEERFWDEFITLIKRYEDQGIIVEDIFFKENIWNADVFQDFICLINSHLDRIGDNKELVGKEYFTSLFSEFNQKIGDSRNVCENKYVTLNLFNGGKVMVHNNYYDSYRCVCSTLEEFFDAGFLKLEGGQVVKNNIKVLPTDNNKITQIKNDSVFKMIEGVITKDGSFYMSLNLHEPTLNYLLACGKSVKGAVRVQQDEYAKRVDYSSFYNYLSFDEFDDDKIIRLTDAQAKTMAELFNTLNDHKQIASTKIEFSSFLNRCNNLGWCLFSFSRSVSSSDFSVPLAKRNIRLLKEYYAGEFDDESFLENVVDEFRLLRTSELNKASVSEDGSEMN